MFVVSNCLFVVCLCFLFLCLPCSFVTHVLALFVGVLFVCLFVLFVLGYCFSCIIRFRCCSLLRFVRLFSILGVVWIRYLFSMLCLVSCVGFVLLVCLFVGFLYRFVTCFHVFIYYVHLVFVVVCWCLCVCCCCLLVVVLVDL